MHNYHPTGLIYVQRGECPKLKKWNVYSDEVKVDFQNIKHLRHHLRVRGDIRTFDLKIGDKIEINVKCLLRDYKTENYFQRSRGV